jgi:predicted nucleic-acid-binding Zn-ribbon protein
MKSKRKCDKCGSTNFESHYYVNRISEPPSIDFIQFCRECGEFDEEYRKQHNIESANVFMGEIILKSENQL